MGTKFAHTKPSFQCMWHKSHNNAQSNSAHMLCLCTAADGVNLPVMAKIVLNSAQMLCTACGGINLPVTAKTVFNSARMLCLQCIAADGVNLAVMAKIVFNSAHMLCLQCTAADGVKLACDSEDCLQQCTYALLAVHNS